MTEGPAPTVSYPDLDEGYPTEERLPRYLEVDFVDRLDPLGIMRAQMYWDGEPLGDELGDNSYVADGYRFHDVFHLSYAALLGWSPLLRKLLKRKRKSDPAVDDVEDGGRASMIEESISALVFDYARQRDFLEGHASVDGGMLSTIRSLTAGLEVSRRSDRDWETAILRGFDVWREIVRDGGGRIRIDLEARTIELVS